MSEKLLFVRNYSDLSTDRGFQFEFTCDRCGMSYRSLFKPSTAGTISGILDTAGSLLGGWFGSAADISERVRSASWQQARDEAFAEAIAKIKPEFIQCPRCCAWVCRKSCWNDKRGLCKACAPDLGVEMSAAQADRSVEEIWEHAAMAQEDKQLGAENWEEVIQATCPKCEAPLAENAKFCPECGEKLIRNFHCTECGKKLKVGTKFCPDCGTKLEMS